MSEWLGDFGARWRQRRNRNRACRTGFDEAIASVRATVRRGSLRGRTRPGGAVLGLSLLACASVLPGQWLCGHWGNPLFIHGKEKVYGSIP
jgi:hypothetical protein